MQKIKPEALASAISKMKEMDQVQVEKVIDEINSGQPNLLTSVLVQQRMGNTLEQLEALLNILIVVYLTLKYSNIVINTITEAEQEKQLRLYSEHIHTIDSLHGRAKSKAIKKYFGKCSEKILLAYVTNEMVLAGFTNIPTENGKYLVMTGINIVNCISEAIRMKQYH
jgi:hypothetical protein